MTAFHVGQKVVCINDGPIINDLGNVWVAPQLEERRVYTVTEIRSSRRGIRVAEAEPSKPNNWFSTMRFRPVVERKTSIAIFHEILHTQRVRTDA